MIGFNSKIYYLPEKKSILYKTNRIGPWTEPWGTPQFKVKRKKDSLGLFSDMHCNPGLM